VPVALLVPFDGTQSFRAPRNVARVLNLTQREYAYMRPGAGFHGTLKNVDVSDDPNIGHITIDKSARLHALVLSYVRGAVGAPAPAPEGKPLNISTARHPTVTIARPKVASPKTASPKPAKPTVGGHLDDKATQRDML
jgi:hypothetical protein